MKLENIKVRDKDGHVVEFQMNRIQKVLWNYIQERIQKGEKRFSILKSSVVKDSTFLRRG